MKKIDAGALTGDEINLLLGQGLRQELQRLTAEQTGAADRTDAEIDTRIDTLEAEITRLKRAARRNDFELVEDWTRQAAQSLGLELVGAADISFGRRALSMKREIAELEKQTEEGDDTRQLPLAGLPPMKAISVLGGNPIQPKAVNNARDDKLQRSNFWRKSFEERRCLIQATSYCEPKGRNPAAYVWFGVVGDEERPPFALAGIWRAYKGDYGGGEEREMLTSSMVTTTPNELTRQTHPDRSPTILAPDDYEQWLTGTPDEAFALIRPFPAARMVIHQSREGLKSDRGGLGAAG